MKITPTMRRMVQDREFAEAIAMLISAQDRLRDLEEQRKAGRGVRPFRVRNGKLESAI